jgi:hypothetical protein
MPVPLSLCYWIEKPVGSVFPSELIGLVAFCGRTKVGTILGGRWDDTMAVIDTDTGRTVVARHVDFVTQVEGASR